MPPHTKRKRNKDDTRGRAARQCRTRHEHGHRNTHRAPPFNKATERTRGGTSALDGEVSTAAPALHSPYHPTSPCHPTLPQCPHPPPRTGGRRSEDTPPHEQHRHTHHPHTTHPARRSTQHDRSTGEYRTGMSRARGAPLDKADSSSTPTAIPHTAHERTDTIRTVSPHTVHVHTPTNDRDQRTTIIDQ